MELEYQLKLASLIRGARIGALATLRNNAAAVSMVPYSFAEDLSALYILTSELAMHTQDMQKNKTVSLLIREADDGREDPLTLARVELRASAEMLLLGEPGYTPARERYLERFPMAAALFEFEDFRLWRLVLKGGRYVAGFAKAFNLSAEALASAGAASEAEKRADE